MKSKCCAIDLERMFYYTLLIMSILRRVKNWLTGFQQKKRKYNSILGESLHLRSNDTATQETSPPIQFPASFPAAGPPRELKNDPLYIFWINLSRREQEVTAYTCLRYTNPQIAARLGLSKETVRTYLEKVMNKLGIQTKADLRVAFANWDFSEWE